MSDDLELPVGWYEAALFDVCRPKQWPTISTADLTPSGYPVYGANGKIGLYPKYTHDNPTILITCRGATCGTINVCEPKSWVNGNAMALDDLETDVVDFNYALLALKNRGFSDVISGSAQPQITRAGLEPVTFPLAPLPEQRRIVAKIEALQARSRKAREALEAILPLLEQFRQSVLAAAFRGDLTADWREQHPDVEPASVLLERIRTERRRKWEQAELAKFKAKGKVPKDDSWKEKYVEPEPVDDTDLPELPEGWCWVTLDAVSFVTKLAGFEYTKYVKYDQDGDLSVIKAENAGKQGFRRTDFSRVRSQSIEHLTRSRLVPGDLLMVFVGAGVGQVAIVPDDQPYFLGPNIAMIRVESSCVNAFYVERFLRSPIGFDLAMSFTKAVAQPSLSMTTIRQIPIPVPPISEQAKVMSILNSTIEKSLVVNETIDSLLNLLASSDQSILAKAFRGELVPQDPNDEPASVLLERIRAEQAEDMNGKPPRGRRKRTSKVMADD